MSYHSLPTKPVCGGDRIEEAPCLAAAASSAIATHACHRACFFFSPHAGQVPGGLVLSSARVSRRVCGPVRPVSARVGSHPLQQALVF